MAMSQDAKEEISFYFFVFGGILLLIGAFILCGYLSFTNGEFSGACKQAGGSVTDTVCIDGNTVLFTYDSWDE